MTISRSSRAFLVSLFGLLWWATAWCAEPPGAESARPTLPEDVHPALRRILDHALAQSPRMLLQAAQLAAAEADATVARSVLLPSASAFGQFNEQRETRRDLPGAHDSEKTYYNVGVTQPVFHWGALRNNARIGQLRLKLESGQTAEAYRLLVNEIRSQYLQLIIKRQMLSRARFGVDVARENDRLAQEKLAGKLISAGEAGAAHVAVTLGELAADRSEEDYTYSKAALERLAGCGVIAEDELEKSVAKITPAPAATRSLEAEFLGQPEPDSYVLRNFKRQAQIEGLNYDIARVRLRPKLNLVVGASQDEVSYTANLGQKYGVQALYAGLQVNWAIFDGFATRGSKAAARARQRYYELNYQQASDQLKAQVQHAAKQLGFAARQLSLAEDGITGAEILVKSYKEQLARGELSAYDVKVAEASLLDAQIGASNARSDYLMRTAEFLSLLQKDPALNRLPAAP